MTRGKHNRIATKNANSRNISLGNKRTSIRLEAQFWDALYEISEAEDMSIDELCTLVDRRRPKTIGFSSALRVYILQYFRED